MKFSVATEEDRLGVSTVPRIIARHATLQPDAVALVEPDSVHTYKALSAHIDAVGAAFAGAGIGREARVAILLPNGAQLATAIVSVTCHAVAVPLDPNLTNHELEHVFARLRIDAAIVSRGSRVPAACAGRSLHNVADLGYPGLLLYGAACPGRDIMSDALPETIGVILRTSGTTAEPKLVAHSHRNITSRTHRVQRSLGLTTADRSLCVGPICYSQGLYGSLFYSLIIGGSNAYPSLPQDALPDDFLSWFAEFDPTWFSTGPTMLLNMLDQSRTHPGSLHARSLRLIQVGGAPMEEHSRISVEQAFGVPVLANYGATEAGQMANNAYGVPPRGPGMFGLPDPDSIGICDENGQLLGPGVSGQILSRGPTVTPGNYDAEGILRPILVDGWYRTGDLGFIDADGFLTVTGRIKDIINRGGEKISPAEIDLVLSGHPDVVEGASFPVPHPRLGEDVVAAVVLRPGAHVTSLQLRRFVEERLAGFKVPRRVHFVDEIPKGPTGKVLRAELRRRFALPPALGSDGPRTTLEIEIVAIWRKLLGLKSVDPMADFFQLGGDSLLAVQMLFDLESVVGHELSESLLFEAATPRQLAAAVADSSSGLDLLVPLRPHGEKQPLLFFDGDLGGGGYYTRRLADYVEQRPIWLMRPFATQNGRVPSIEAMARQYLALAREAGLKPPFLFGGHCNGALIAIEAARQAEARGDRVDVVLLIDPISFNARPEIRFLGRVITACVRSLVRDRVARERATRWALTQIWEVPLVMEKIAFNARRPRRLARRVQAACRYLLGRDRVPGEHRMNWKRAWAQNEPDVQIDDDPITAVVSGDEQLDRRYKERMSAFKVAMASFFPSPVSAKVVAFTAQSSRKRLHSASPWMRFGNSVECVTVHGSHLGCITTDVDVLGHNVRRVLEPYA